MTTTGTPRQVPVKLDTGLRKDVGKLRLLFTGVGAIIGSGWLFGALLAAHIAGPAAVIAWCIGGLIMMFIGLVSAELSVMFPVSGGTIRFPHYAFGSFASFSCGWTNWLATAAVAPIEVLATTQYADPYIPWLMDTDGDTFVLTAPGLIVAIVLMAVYSVINILGAELFARLNNILVWWKLLVIAVVIVAFAFLAFHPENIVDVGGFAPYGYGAIFTAIPAAGVAFAYLGFRNAVDFAGETDNPQRNVPFAIIGSIVITGAIYVLLQLAFLTAVPGDLLEDGWSALAFENEGAAGPLAGLSLALGATWLAFLLRVDAVVSPADTGLIYAGVTTRLAFANARNKNAPQSLTKLNKHGIPWIAVILTFGVGCFFFLPFPGWQQFIGFITSAFAISFGSAPLVVGALRRQLPDQARPFKLPGKDIIPVLAFFGSSLLVYWAGWDINEKMLIALLSGYIVFAVYHYVARDKVPPVDFKAGSWFPIWITGLAVISYFGDNNPNAEAKDGLIFDGGNGPLNLTTGAIVIALFSVAVYAYAIAVRLPASRAAAYISETPHVDPDSEPGHAHAPEDEVAGVAVGDGAGSETDSASGDQPDERK